MSLAPSTRWGRAVDRGPRERMAELDPARGDVHERGILRWDEIGDLQAKCLGGTCEERYVPTIRRCCENQRAIGVAGKRCRALQVGAGDAGDDGHRSIDR